MKRLRLLGLALMAVFALGVIAVASASATERGLLLLPKEEGTVEISGVEGAITAELAFGGKVITCTGLSLLKITLEGPHLNLGKDGELHFTKCKQGAIACSSQNAAGEKDPKETILVLVDVHLVNLINAAGQLEPGLAVIVLGTPTDKAKPPLKINCGGVIIEVIGGPIGVATPLNAKKEVTLSEDVTDIDLRFATGTKCDPTNETVCQELLEKSPLLSKVGEKFELATQTTTLFLVTTSKMVLVDD